MNAKEVIDLTKKIVARQDFDRELALSFINNLSKQIMRDKKIMKFLDYKTDVDILNGVIDTNSINLKQAEVVEWYYTNDENNLAKVSLAKIPNYRYAMLVFGSLTNTGSPQAYLELGQKIYILPAPVTGSINIYGEWWPENLTDSASCTNTITQEIGEGLAYLGSAEYLDMLQEEQRANYWRQKGLAAFDSYLKSLLIQETNNITLNRRDPWGNLKPVDRTATEYSSFSLEDLDLGGW